MELAAAEPGADPRVVKMADQESDMEYSSDNDYEFEDYYNSGEERRRLPGHDSSENANKPAAARLAELLNLHKLY